MTTHTKPASAALQLMGILILLLGLVLFGMGPWPGSLVSGLGLWLLVSGGRSTRKRIKEDQS